MTESTTAILLFSRRASSEAQHKYWLAPARAGANLALARDLVREAGRTADRSGLPVYHFHEGKQRGHSFGERLANAFADLFARGYQSVIAIGNDTPGLRRLEWTDVVQPLAAGQQVIGRTVQGGAYLIGLQAERFDRASFEALPWETADLGTALEAWMARAVALEVLHELNDQADLLLWLKQAGAHHQLARRWSTLVGTIATAFPFSPALLPAVVWTNHTLRGPPFS